MADRPTFRWRAYGWLVEALSFLHYAVLSRFSQSDEGGTAWLAKRRNPMLPAPAAGRRIWIHAVSAGESKVAELLRGELLRQEPGLSVVLSSTTYAGYARIRAIAGDAASFIMPLDTPAAQQRLFADRPPGSAGAGGIGILAGPTGRRRRGWRSGRRRQRHRLRALLRPAQSFPRVAPSHPDARRPHLCPGRSDP